MPILIQNLKVILFLNPIKNFNPPTPNIYFCVRIGCQSSRQEQSHLNTYVEMRFFYGCINGVAYIVVPTQKVTPKKSYHYLNQKRDEYGNFIKSDNVQ